MQDVRARLERERSDLIRRLQELGVVDDEPGPRLSGMNSVVDEADHAQVDERREMGLVTRQRIAARINRLTAALRRLDQGTYGTCVECGQPIEPARLEALPEAETCRACQERLERTGRAA